MSFITELSNRYNYPEWIILLCIVFFIVFLVVIVFLIIKIIEPKYKQYTQDKFFNLNWKWKYKKDKIIDLWCYCPHCNSMLHVDDENCKTTSNLGEKITFFVCNNCGEREVGRITGGDRKYALKMVEREILSKIRLNTFDIYKKLEK
jgi:predicted RNA-binding Zn-ribbon protein involved in translation (DUF1610 family)